MMRLREILDYNERMYKPCQDINLLMLGKRLHLLGKQYVKGDAGMLGFRMARDFNFQMKTEDRSIEYFKP